MADAEGYTASPKDDRPRREKRREKKEKKPAEATEEGGAAVAPDVFVLMDNLLDKLKLLDYDTKFCKKFKLKPISRHYFSLAGDAAQQLNYFANLMSWLLSLAGKKFDPPDEFDDPNTICSNILTKLKELGLVSSLSQVALRSGSGEEICNILNNLAQSALKASNWKWSKPKYPKEVDDVQEEEDANVELEATVGLQGTGADNDDIVEDIDDDMDGMDEAAAIPQHDDEAPFGSLGSTKIKQTILTSQIDAAAWKTEVERVMPQLKVQIRTDNKDWRAHVEQMMQYQTSIKDLLSDTQKHLDGLHSDISKTLEKIESREKYVNTQLDNIVSEFRQKQDKLAATNDRYKQASTTVVELAAQLASLTDELDTVKAQMDERGNRMTDSQPLVKIKQALTRLKKEISQMDLRIGVVQHTLLSAKMDSKHSMMFDMHGDGGDY